MIPVQISPTICQEKADGLAFLRLSDADETIPGFQGMKGNCWPVWEPFKTEVLLGYGFHLCASLAYADRVLNQGFFDSDKTIKDAAIHNAII